MSWREICDNFNHLTSTWAACRPDTNTRKVLFRADMILIITGSDGIWGDEIKRAFLLEYIIIYLYFVSWKYIYDYNRFNSFSRLLLDKFWCM